MAEGRERHLRHRRSRAKRRDERKEDDISQTQRRYEHVNTTVRWIIVSMHQFHELSTSKISKYTGVSLRTIQRIILAWQEREQVWGINHIDVSDIALVRAGCMSNADATHLWQFLQEHPTSYLTEMQTKLEQFAGKSYSLSTLSRTLFHMGITRKRLSRSSHKASFRLRVLFREKLWRWVTNNDQLIFIDEASKNEAASTRNYGWGPKCSNVSDPIGGIVGKRKSVVAGYSLNSGMFAWQSIEETYNAERFEDWFTDMLLPQTQSYPQPNSVVIIDNARIHNKERLMQFARAKDVIILFLPPYSPDWNPIEIMWACIKNRLRAVGRGQNDDFDELLAHAISYANEVTNHEAVFEHCGYVYDDSGLLDVTAGYRPMEELQQGAYANDD